MQARDRLVSHQVVNSTAAGKKCYAGEDLPGKLARQLQALYRFLSLWNFHGRLFSESRKPLLIRLGEK